MRFDPYYQKRTDPIKEMIKRDNMAKKKTPKEKAFPLPFKGEYMGSLAQFALLTKFKYINGKDKVNVPIGFITDGASIPPLVFSLIGSPWRGKYVEATIPHDYLCYLAVTPEERKEAARMFLDGLKILGVSAFKRWLMYRAVRLGDWWKMRGYRR